MINVLHECALSKTMSSKIVEFYLIDQKKNSMLFSLLLATAAASTQLDQWRALIQTNADSNPHAQYDIEDMTGKEQCQNIVHQHALNANPCPGA